MSPTKLRSLCIKNNWFTYGCNEQYGRLFDRAREGANIEELATIIWICSENVSKEAILKELSR